VHAQAKERQPSFSWLCRSAKRSTVWYSPALSLIARDYNSGHWICLDGLLADLKCPLVHCFFVPRTASFSVGCSDRVCLILGVQSSPCRFHLRLRNVSKTGGEIKQLSTRSIWEAPQNVVCLAACLVAVRVEESRYRPIKHGDTRSDTRPAHWLRNAPQVSVLILRKCFQ
jgi:hypothetical protein